MPAYKPVDRQKMILEYMDAYRLANPDRTMPIISYLKSHYRFKMRQDFPWEKRGFRHRQMQRMLKTLRSATPQS